VRDFERNGLGLTLARREEVQNLRTQMDKLSMEYIKNLNDDCTFLVFTKTDLDGLPSEFLQSLGRADDGSFKVQLRSNIVSPIFEHCKVGRTRRKLASEYGQRCKEVNMPVLETLVQLRHKLARLLGYKNYADYAVEFRMAKTSTRVIDFLEEISVSLADFASRELTVLKDLKNKEEGDSPFGVEDLLYYIKRAEEKEFDIDFGSLKQYFPLNLVLDGFFKIIQDTLGLRFDEISDAVVWHSDVQMYSVSDSSSSESLGYAYFDLYSREGKYGQSCFMSLQNGSLSSSGARQVPVALLISSFHKEVGGQPGLLRFSEVVNLFHEFGHVVHHLCNRSSFVRFSGLRVDPDFMEIPSQVFESWCFESSILKLMSGFHQDITRTIRDDICTSLKKWQHSFAALKLRQEILYSLFDQVVHSDDNVDFLELFKYLHSKIMLGLPILDGMNPASCFPHSAIGYQATCYGRLWSKVFAADVFASKFHDGLLNKCIGLQFRSKVLAPGGAKNPTESLSDFLGREPSIQAFVDNIVSSNSS
ncbi:putative thimet oligopeptidase, partial [Drosera capensis]